MNEWSPPQSVEYRAPANGLGVLRKMLEDLSRRISALEGAAPLRQSGVRATTDGLIVDSSLTILGDLAASGTADITGTTHIGGATVIDGATTIDDTLHITGATDIDGTLNVDAATTIGGTLGVTGVTTLGAPTTVSGTLGVTGVTTLGGATTVSGTLGVTGAATIGGNLTLGGSGTVTGTLQSSDYVAGTSGWRLTSTGLEVNSITLKGSIVPDAALAHETRAAANVGTATPTITTTPTAYAATSVTVPAGFTQASAIAVSTISLGSTALYGHVLTRIAGDDGQRQDVPVTSSSLGAGSSAHARVWAVTGGSTITASSVADIASGTAPSGITTVLMVTFYR